MDQIANLTDQQIVNVYFRPHDTDDDGKHGYVPAKMKRKTEAEPEYVTHKEMFWMVWDGLPEEEIRKKWLEHTGGKEDV